MSRTQQAVGAAANASVHGSQFSLITFTFRELRSIMSAPDLRSILSSGAGIVIDAKGATQSVATIFPPSGAPAPPPDADPRSEKIIALYFSANWCPPCHQFLPRLRHTYQLLKQQDRDFEIIFVSWDNNEKEFAELTSKMPWLRLPFNDARCRKLTEVYAVSSIPTLIFVRARDNHIVTRSARMSIVADPSGKDYPWAGGTEVVGGGFGRRTLLFVVLFLLFVGYRAFRSLDQQPFEKRATGRH